jgi:hypothetical protein
MVDHGTGQLVQLPEPVVPVRLRLVMEGLAGKGSTVAGFAMDGLTGKRLSIDGFAMNGFAMDGGGHQNAKQTT